MKIVTYNINGIRAAKKLGLIKWMDDYNADVYCFQEVRANQQVTSEILAELSSQIILFDGIDKKSILDKFTPIYNCGSISGYAGTLILTKEKPKQILYDMGEFWTDIEGRTTTIFLENLIIVNAYIPNGNSRLEFKIQYLEALIKFLRYLKTLGRVVCVGDFNICHNEIDLTHPKECSKRSVFLPIERQKFDALLNLGLYDCFRENHPNKKDYTWRSYLSRQTEISSGKNFWKYRIDYILASFPEFKTCEILDLEYSDHLPVVINI